MMDPSFADSKQQLKTISSLKDAKVTKANPLQLYDAVQAVAIALVMGNERYLRQFEASLGFPVLSGVVDKYVKECDEVVKRRSLTASSGSLSRRSGGGGGGGGDSKRHSRSASANNSITSNPDAKPYLVGDILVVCIRSLALMCEYVPSAHEAGQAYHSKLMTLTCSVMHKAFCNEWTYENNDSRNLLEECLRLIRFIARDDNTGSIVQDTLVGDLLTLCAGEDTLVVRQALEALSMLCSKVVLPSESVKTSGINSLLAFFKGGKGGGGGKSGSSGVAYADHPIVVNVENVMAPFLQSLVEQQVNSVEAMPEVWPLLELTLQCIGMLIERAMLCHRPLTAKAVVSRELPGLVYRLINMTDSNVALEPNIRSDRILFLETILAILTDCNRVQMADSLLLPEARKFMRGVMQEGVAEDSTAITTLLDDPFPRGGMAARSTQRRDKDHITSIAAIQLFLLACPSVPPDAFGLKPKVALPVHQWLWEDELRHPNRLVEEQCVALETAWAKLERETTIRVHARRFTVDLYSMNMGSHASVSPSSSTMACGAGMRNVSRSFVPFVYHFADEVTLRPVVNNVKETGPYAVSEGAGGDATSGGHSGKHASSKKEETKEELILNRAAVVTANHIAIGEEFFELLCAYATEASGQMAKQVATCACASILQLLLLFRGSRDRICALLSKAMLPMCLMFREALLTSDKATKAVVLTMIEWMLHLRSLSPSFSRTAARCGLLDQLDAQANIVIHVGSKDNRPTRTATLAEKSRRLHTTITQNCGLATPSPALRPGTAPKATGMPPLQLGAAAAAPGAGDAALLGSAVETERITASIAALQQATPLEGVHEACVKALLDDFHTCADVTSFEVHRLGLAKVVLNFLLRAHSLEEVLGTAVVFKASASGCTSNSAVRSSRDRDERVSPPQPCLDAPLSTLAPHVNSRMSDFLRGQMDDKRVECLLRCGLECPEGMQKIIRHLVAALAQGVSFPTVESLVTSAPVHCQSPLSAFHALTNLSPKVRLCGAAGDEIFRLTDPAVPPSPTLEERRAFCQNGHRLRRVALYGTRCQCDVCSTFLVAGFACRQCNFDLCVPCQASRYTGCLPHLMTPLPSKSRANLTASVGDVERFFRTGTTSVKATQSAPTSQSNLQHLEYFLERVKLFLSREASYAARAAAPLADERDSNGISSSTRASSDERRARRAFISSTLLGQPDILRWKLYEALSKHYTRGVLPNPPAFLVKGPNGDIDTDVVERLVSTFSSLFPETDDVALVEELVAQGMEDRYLLYRPFHGYCHMHETLFSVLYKQAFNIGNKSMLVQLENCLVRAENGFPKREVGIDFNGGAQPASPSARNVRSAFFEGDLLLETKVSKDYTLAFHHFENDATDMCSCGAHSRVSLDTQLPAQMQLAAPAFAQRDDVLLLIVLHKMFCSHATLSKTSSQVMLKSSEYEPLFVNTTVTNAVVRSLAASALRVALLPPKFALPRWASFVIQEARFLIPLRTRERIARFLAYGARRSLIQHMRIFRMQRNDKLVNVSPGEFARLSNHKFIVRRDKLLQDACQALRKCADARLPVSMEFAGDVGVGQGPTAHFYTLLAKEVSRAHLRLWRNVTIAADAAVPAGVPPDAPLPASLRAFQSGGGPADEAEGSDTAFIVPPPEGLYPRRARQTPALEAESPPPAIPCAGDSAASRFVTLEDPFVCLKDYDTELGEQATALYAVGAALGRAFMDEQVFPLQLSAALALFLHRGLPPVRRVIDAAGTLHSAAAGAGAAAAPRAPVDLYEIPLALTQLVDGTIAFSLQSLSSLDAETLKALEVSFTLPGDDGYELVPGGKAIFVTKENLAQYQRCVVNALLFQSVSLPLRLIVRGCLDVVPHEALQVLEVSELMRFMCGEDKGGDEPLWTVEEIRAVLVGDHGYQNDSPQLEMLANILAKRLTPREQRAFLLFCTGCPRLPVGGIHALGAITVVRRSNAFAYVRSLAERAKQQQEAETNASAEEHAAAAAAASAEEEEGGEAVGAAAADDEDEEDDAAGPAASASAAGGKTTASAESDTADCAPLGGGVDAEGLVTPQRAGTASDLSLTGRSASSCPGDGAMSSPLGTHGRMQSFDTDTEGRTDSIAAADIDVDADWALPSVNTCFRYLKLPPYPSEDLMYNKLRLSITQAGDFFDLS